MIAESEKDKKEYRSSQKGVCNPPNTQLLSSPKLSSEN